MATVKEQSWLETLRRECGVRRALILHGNVNDVYRHPATHEYRPLLDTVTEVLRKRGIDAVVPWDRLGGLQHADPAVVADLTRHCVGLPAAPPTGEAYDLGPEPPASPPTGRSSALPDPKDFFALVEHHFRERGRKRYAFVIDWSQFLFGNPGAPSEEERVWLLYLARALRNAPVDMSVEALQKPANLLLLVCPKLGAVPPLFYQGNELVKDIHLPVPGRPERQEFLKRHVNHLHLQPPLTPSGPAFADFIDSTEGSSLRDLQNLCRLSRQVEAPLRFDKLVNLYRYGEKSSPWEELSREKLAGIEERLKEWVKGQDEAVTKVRDVILRAFTGLAGLQHSRKQKMPKGVLFFVGPTGVGKTELAKALARFLFNDEDAFLRFDMSEYNHDHSDQRLVGAPPGYVGYEEGGQLTNAVRRRPFAVLLFDEIEKAHPRILDKFLQILEDGRLTDGKGDTVSFAETVIIFTSNIGAAEVRPVSTREAVRQQFQEKVRTHFVEVLKRPELLNRIGNNVVPFNFLCEDGPLLDIARAKLRPLVDFLREKYRLANLRFGDEERALRAVLARLDRAHGGRGVLNELATCLIDPLAAFLFEAGEPADLAGKTIRVIQAGQEARFVFELED
jgi:hypothetical protein